MKRWSLNLGGAREDLSYICVDIEQLPGVDIVADLSKTWPFKDDSIDHFRAANLIEHLPDKIHTMTEAYRCLKLHGEFEIYVPTTDSRAAFQDPTHVSFWNMNSFMYYSSPWNTRYKIACNFKIISIQEYDYGDVPMGRYVHVVLQKVEM